MKLLLSLAAGAGLLLTGCAQTSDDSAAQRTASADAPGSTNRLTGDRSAGPLGSNIPTSTGTYSDPSGLAGHSGSQSFPTSNTVRGGR